MKRFRIIRSQAGLTLVEIMMVLIILGIIMGVVMSRVVGAGDRAKRQTTELKLKMLQPNIEQYRLQYNTFPGSLRDLIQCNQVTGSNCVPILGDEDTIRDAWGNDFLFQVERNRYRITSLGADGVAGGSGVDADISVEGP